MGNLISDLVALKEKFSQILFVYNTTLGCSKKNTGHYPKNAFEEKGIRTPKLKFSLRLALIGLRTTGPRTIDEYGSLMKILRGNIAID